MKKDFKKIINQAVHFFIVSGVGWIFDFLTYILVTNIFNIRIFFANMISAIPALTYVFLMSNKKIFKNENSKISLKYKYIIYFVYQLILLLAVSFLGDLLYIQLGKIIKFDFILKHLKLVVKILITPITMTLNFIAMKNLIEKI